MSITRILPAKDVDSHAILLNSEMRRISEDHYCAGWMMGLELSLWELMMLGGGGYGMGVIVPEVAWRLCDMAHHAGGWWYWPEKNGDLLTDEEQYTDLVSWQSSYEAYLAWYVMFRIRLRKVASR